MDWRKYNGKKGQCQCRHMRGEHYNTFSEDNHQSTYGCKKCNCQKYFPLILVSEKLRMIILKQSPLNKETKELEN